MVMERFSKILENLAEKLTISSEYEELQNDLIEKIENGTNTDDATLQLRTMENYIEDTESVSIIGLVNDSEVFDFYMKHRNQLDSILSEVEHFDKSPESIGVVNSVYEYIIISTRIAIQESFKKMINKDYEN